jgi:stage V sporulation protein D (sporulation-specific penicillin-binding protein)
LEGLFSYQRLLGRKIYDWNRVENGIQDFAEILQNSSNVGFALLGEELGRDKLYKYIDNFGFGKKTGIDVSFEESGYKTPINKVGPVELANISFGQGIAVTPIQMVSAYAAIANGGKMMAPHLVKSIVSTDQDGKAISSREIQPALLRQAVDKETADKLMEYLETVVAVGGGHEAYIQGYRIAGKTGTAQKAENGGYASGKYIDTFIGVAPADNPQFVVLVSVDEPNSSNYYASHVVAPVAGQIFRDIFSIRNMSPDMGDGSGMGTIPDVTGLTQRDAEKRLKFIGFKVEVNGNGTAVKTVNPASGTSVKLGSVVKLGMGNVDNYSTKVVVPQINGMGAKQAQSLLDSLGLKSKISGGGRISSQNPAAGNIVDKGAVISAQAR